MFNIVFQICFYIYLRSQISIRYIPSKKPRAPRDNFHHYMTNLNAFSIFQHSSSYYFFKVLNHIIIKIHISFTRSVQYLYKDNYIVLSLTTEADQHNEHIQQNSAKQFISFLNLISFKDWIKSISAVFLYLSYYMYFLEHGIWPVLEQFLNFTISMKQFFLAARIQPIQTQ